MFDPWRKCDCCGEVDDCGTWNPEKRWSLCMNCADALYGLRGEEEQKKMQYFVDHIDEIRKERENAAKLAKQKEKERIKTMSGFVKSLRVRTGLSRKKFAELYHIPVRTLEGWEQGRREPNATVIQLICDLMDAKNKDCIDKNVLDNFFKIE